MAKRYRADQVGSFLRPPSIVDAHAKLADGKLTLEDLEKIEDAAIEEILDMQRQAGIHVYSDGEFRRRGWASNITDAIDGYVEGTPSIRLQANVPGGGQGGGGGGAGAGGGFRRVLGADVSKKHDFAIKDAAFLKTHAPGPYKVTMPAPSYVVARAYNPEISDKHFGSRKALLTAVAELIQQEIAVLISRGVPYIQLDNPHYTDYVSEDIREQYRALGMDRDEALREDVEADNICYRGVDRGSVTFGMHLCRGNTGGGGWHKAGGYENVAEIVFGSSEADAFLLEYDSERAGTFEPLRFMPKGKTAVLGLITTKSGELETEDLIKRRIEEAGQFMDLDDATLSPQCGFASTFQGNPLTPDEQKRKLELVVNVARSVWSE